MSYPAGVRRNKVVRQDPDLMPMDGGVSSPVFNSPDPPSNENYRSFIARPEDYKIEDPEQEYAAGVLLDEEDGPDAEINTLNEPVPESYNAEFQDSYRNDRNENPSEEKRDYVLKPLDLENMERELLDKEFSQFPEAHKSRDKKDILIGPINRLNNNAFKKVQVTEEETGTQRVQVNAGYENPKITCVSGYNSCSGVVLKFVLTFHGTNDANNAQRGMPCIF